ncbi:MAG: BlaI/MecI/CopY family transcriptional regulator [Bacteroidales bacterium]|nr:BlaI/MecI/CopY family transcriptional regulator [Lachnoclostridium sp.]MCM1384141.1 BlaI/MecI/CopY family transcriptional regulator [Lachnoclostridium sp.]MCM1464807.1 BlaI/MecI/CopY family transcriptional regulator [Bacteroidales bacterium]
MVIIMGRQELSKCEGMVMKAIWSSEDILTMQEITVKVNTLFHKTWKTQTVSTYLARLVKKEYLSMERQGRLFYYHPLIAEEDYAQGEISKCVDMWGNAKIGALLSAFTQTKGLTEEEREYIRSILEDGQDDN